MPYGQNLRVKKARAGSEAKNNARRKELMKKKKANEAGDKTEVNNNPRRKELMEKKKPTAKSQAYKNKTKRNKRGYELTKDMPYASYSERIKRKEEALKKDDAKKKIRNAKEKAVILKSRKPVKPKSATQIAAEKKRAKEKAVLKKIKKRR